MKFPNLKVGDKVFVVQQQTRYRRDRNIPPETSTETVAKVGRLYGYYESSGRRLRPFHLSNGESAHKEYNERANGYGFDVYATEDEYKAKILADELFLELKIRLTSGYYGIVPLPHEVVVEIHRILDKYGVK